MLILALPMFVRKLSGGCGARDQHVEVSSASFANPLIVGDRAVVRVGVRNPHIDFQLPYMKRLCGKHVLRQSNSFALEKIR